jgi:ribonuclease P protein component
LQEATMQKKLQLNIFFIYTGKELPAFNIVREKVNVILNKLTKFVNENNSPDT